MKAWVLLLLLCVAGLALAAGPAGPATAASRAQGAAVAVRPASSAAEPSMLGRLVAWVFEQQRAFHRELTQALRGLTADGGAKAGIGLIVASFLYGIFHAAGPGHGKAVLTTYLLTHRQRVARGVWLAAAAAACQGLAAIVLVYGLIWLAGWLPRETSAAVAWSERLSYIFVLLVGASLAIRAMKSARSRLAARTARGACPAAAGGASHPRGEPAHRGHDGSCGQDHAHGPSVEQIERAAGLRTALGLVLSIGLRPCSGAVLVLVFAYAMSLAWAGVAAVAAMSLGTAAAIAALAFLAVSARRWAARMAGRAGAGRYRLVADAVALGGGLAVMAIGLALVAASFAPPHPLGLS